MKDGGILFIYGELLCKCTVKMRHNVKQTGDWGNGEQSSVVESRQEVAVLYGGES